MRKVVDEAITRRATGEQDDSARGAPNTPVEERMMSRTDILDEIICRVRFSSVFSTLIGRSNNVSRPLTGALLAFHFMV